MTDQALLHWWAKVSCAFVRLVQGAPNVVLLPRAQTHWITLDVRGIPRRFLSSSLRLQLRKFLGQESFSFAYSVKEGIAGVWYWLESGERAHGDNSVKELTEVWPEVLLRQRVADGLHLIRCRDGFEAVYLRFQALVRTRWFPALPTNDCWDAFVRDSGLDPAANPMPDAADIALSKEPPSNWRISRSGARSLSGAVWGAVGLVTLLGMLVVICGALSLKLSAALSIEKRNHERLMKEHAVTISLQRKIDEIKTYLGGFSGLRTSYSQLELIESLIDAGLLSEKEKISLAEWEFKNNRLRLLFSVPQENFSLGMFLSVLEKQPKFSGMSLMPDTPVGTVGVQLVVASPGVAGERGAADSPTFSSSP